MKNIKNNKITGEISTILTLGSLILITIFSLASTSLLKKNQTTKIKASTTNCSKVDIVEAKGDFSAGKVISCIFETDGRKPRNMACGLSKNNGWPSGMLSASCSGKKCKALVKIDDQINPDAEYRLVAFDFSSECGPETGNKILLNISKNTPSPQEQLPQKPKEIKSDQFSGENNFQVFSDQQKKPSPKEVESLKITIPHISPTTSDSKGDEGKECLSSYAGPNIEYRCNAPNLVPSVSNNKCICVNSTVTTPTLVENYCNLNNKRYKCSQPEFFTETCEKRIESLLVEGERFKKVSCDSMLSSICQITCKTSYNDDNYSGSCNDDSTCIVSNTVINHLRERNDYKSDNDSQKIKTIMGIIKCNNNQDSFMNEMRNICNQVDGYIQKYNLYVYGKTNIQLQFIDGAELIKTDDSIKLSINTESIPPSICEDIVESTFVIGNMVFPLFYNNVPDVQLIGKFLSSQQSGILIKCN